MSKRSLSLAALAVGLLALIVGHPLVGGLLLLGGALGLLPLRMGQATSGPVYYDSPIDGVVPGSFDDNGCATPADDARDASCEAPWSDGASDDGSGSDCSDSGGDSGGGDSGGGD